MAAPVTLVSRSVHSGMVDKVDPWLIGENTAAFLQNLDVSRPGSRKRRFGTASIGGRTDAPAGLWRAKDIALNQEVLFALYGGKPYVLSGAGDLAERASGISLTDSLHQGVEGRWNTRLATYISQVQVADSNATLASNLAVIDDNGGYSQCSFMPSICAVWFQARIWAVQADQPETVYWSEIDDGLSYSLTNSAPMEAGIGGRITGMVPIRGEVPQLIIFKERAICAFEPRWGSSSAFIPGPADALDTIGSLVRVISLNVGCVATRSIQYIPGAKVGDIIFLSREGFRVIQRGDTDVVSGSSQPISDPILSTIRRINFAHANKAVSAIHETIYHCAVPMDGATENTHIISFDLTNGNWYLNTWAARDLVPAILTEQGNRLWMQYVDSTTDCSATGAFDGYHVFRCFDDYLDPDGVAVQIQEDTRAFMPGSIRDKNAWDSVSFSIRNESTETSLLTVLYNVDQEGWVTAGSLAVAGTVPEVVLGETPLPWIPKDATMATKHISLADAPPGHEIQIRYVSNDVYSLPTVLEVAVNAHPIGPEFDNAIG